MDAGLEGFFINLDDAQARRANMENMLKAAKVDGWFKRFAAVRPEGAQGDLTRGEVGCLESHLGLLRARNPDSFTLVLEDDAVIGPAFREDLLSALKTAAHDWDLLFLVHTEPLNDVDRMKNLVAACRAHDFFAKHSTVAIEGRDWYRYGTVGYVVSPALSPEVVDLMAELGKARQLPIDGIYRHLISAGVLKAKIVFPYVVGVEMAHLSQIGREAQVRDQLHAVLINLFYRHRNAADLAAWAGGAASDPQALEAQVAATVYRHYIQHC